MTGIIKTCNFTDLGQAIKKARKDRGWTREQVAKMLHLVPRYIQALENEGQHPSLKVLYRLVTLYDISIDEYLLPDTNAKKSTRRRQIDKTLDALSEAELIVVEATVKSIYKLKNRPKG